MKKSDTSTSVVWGTRLISCYEKRRQVGEGTYGTVYLGKDKETGEIVALKEVLPKAAQVAHRDVGVPINILREINILSQCQHENLVRLKEVVTDENVENMKECNLYLVLEYLEHDLSGILQEVSLSFDEIKCLFFQLLSGLRYLHDLQICHRDLKCSNLLISANHVLKLADFGLARRIADEGGMTPRLVTIWYRPPELILGDRDYDLSVDMWSVGCIFVELFIRKPLFPGKNEIAQIKNIFDLCGTPSQRQWPDATKLRRYNEFEVEPRPNILESFLESSGIPEDASSLVSRLLTLDPTFRCTASQALDSPYIINPPGPPHPLSLPPIKLSHDSHEWETKRRHREMQEIAKKQAAASSEPVSSSSTAIAAAGNERREEFAMVEVPLNATNNNHAANIPQNNVKESSFSKRLVDETKRSLTVTSLENSSFRDKTYRKNRSPPSRSDYRTSNSNPSRRNRSRDRGRISRNNDHRNSSISGEYHDRGSGTTNVAGVRGGGNYSTDNRKNHRSRDRRGESNNDHYQRQEHEDRRGDRNDHSERDKYHHRR